MLDLNLSKLLSYLYSSIFLLSKQKHSYGHHRCVTHLNGIPLFIFYRNENLTPASPKERSHTSINKRIFKVSETKVPLRGFRGPNDAPLPFFSLLQFLLYVLLLYVLLHLHDDHRHDALPRYHYLPLYLYF
jgi:hypothetical protein